MARTHGWLLMAFVGIVLTLVEGCHGVHILVDQQTVDTNTSSQRVTLPCLYRTDSENSPQIDWFRLTRSKRKGIVTVDTGNNITAHTGYEGRVARGDGASLVLFDPRVSDEGMYQCEVKVAQDSPDWANSLVLLKVTNQSDSKSNESQVRSDQELTCDSRSSPMWALIIIDWIIPMCCTYAFPEGYSVFRKKLTVVNSYMMALMITVVVSAAVLLVVSIRFLTDCFLGETSSCALRWAVGIPTGLIGDAMLIGLIVFMGWVKIPEPSEKEKKYVTDEEEEEHLEVCLEEIVTEKKTEIHTLAEAPDDIFCMVTMTNNNNNNIYLSSNHRVYLFDQSCNRFEEITLTKASDIFMMTRSGDKLVVSTIGRERRNSGSFRNRVRSSTRKKNVVFIYDPQNHTERSYKMSNTSTAPWVFENPTGEWCITDAENGFVRVLKAAPKFETQKCIGNGFLQSPCCVIQNSAGEYIITDSEKNDVYMFKDGGQFITSIRTENCDVLIGKMASPFQLAVDSKDNLYVASKSINTVHVFSQNYEFLREIHLVDDEDLKLTALMVNPQNDTLYAAYGNSIKMMDLNTLTNDKSSMENQSTR